MTDSYIAIIVAVLGIAGTLGSAVITQLLASRARQAEIDREERARVAEHVRAQADEALATRRACSIAFNAAARGFHARIRHRTHAMRGRERPDDRGPRSTRRGPPSRTTMRNCSSRRPTGYWRPPTG